MPYTSISDLPKAQTDQYNAHQKKAFLEAFNNAYKQYGATRAARSPSHTPRLNAPAKKRGPSDVRGGEDRLMAIDALR